VGRSSSAFMFLGLNQSAISFHNRGLVSSGDAASELPRGGERDEPSLKANASNVASLDRMWDTNHGGVGSEVACGDVRKYRKG